MQLNGPQSEALHNIIRSHFGGEADSPAEFASFVFYKLNVDLFKDWADPGDKFGVQVTDVLKKLRGENLSKFLNALIERASAEADEDSVQIIRTVQEQLLAPVGSSGETRGVPPSALPRKILVAAGKIDKPFAEEIRKLLQSVMEDFDVVGTWENKCRLPDDIDQIWVVIAVLAVIQGQREVKDPPLRTVQAALARLNAARRVVLVALDPRAQSWSEELTKNIDLKDCVQTEAFFREEDGRPIFIGAANDEFIRVEIKFRIGEMGAKLQAAFEQAMAPAGKVAPSSLPGALPRPALAPIIVLGEPQGPAPEDVAQSIKELREALKAREMEFVHWPDGWRNDRVRAAHILFRDPVFIRTVAEGETDTKRVAEDLENALRAVFDAREATGDRLSSCRRVLWRPAGPAWALLEKDADPGRLSDDLDNIETRIAKPLDFVNWLRRFIAPDAIIFHESLGDDRPPGLIRLLRDAVEESLSPFDRKPIVRLRAFKELPNFDNDKLTIIAVDDLPLPPGADFREKALQRFNQFHYKIDNILDQKQTGVDDPPVLRVAMLVQDVSLFQATKTEGSGVRAWKPFRVEQDDRTSSFRAEKSDVEALRQATAALMKKVKSAVQVGGGTQ